MDAADRPLTLPELAEVAEVEYARLHSWLKRGLVQASVQTSTGSGRPNLFSRDDALRARILGDLDRAGVNFKSLQKTAEKLNAHSEFLQGEGVLSVNGTVEFFSFEPVDGGDKGARRRLPAVFGPRRNRAGALLLFVVGLNQLDSNAIKLMSDRFERLPAWAVARPQERRPLAGFPRRRATGNSRAMD